MPPFVKEIVWDAVARGEGLITKWPTSFPSIIQAEEYVCGILEWKRFRYGVVDVPGHKTQEVQTRTHHGIVMKALREGRFKLERQPPTNSALSRAVEAGIEVAQAAVGNRYPQSFPHINIARAHVRKICEEKNLEFKTVSGVSPKQLAMYVHYNAVRRDYEAGKFTLDVKPDTPYNGKWNARPATSKAQSPPPKAYKGYTRPSPAAATTSRINSGTIRSSNAGETPKYVPVARHVPPKPNNAFIKTTSTGSIKTSSGSSIKTTSNGTTVTSSKDQADIMLIDLGTPSTSTQGTMTGPSDFPLIDLSTAVTGPNTLIDLGQPEITLTEDFSALMGIFSADVPHFKDEGLNELLHCEDLVW